MAVCLTTITYIHHDSSCHHDISTRNIVWQWKTSWWMWVILFIWTHFQELTLYISCLLLNRLHIDEQLGMQDLNDHVSVKVSSGCSVTLTTCSGICLFVYLLHICSYILWSTVAEHFSSWFSFVTCMGEKVTCMWCKNQKEIDHLEALGIDEMMILKWVLKN